MSTANLDPLSPFEIGSAVRDLIHQQTSTIEEIKTLDESLDHMSGTLSEILQDYYHVSTKNDLTQQKQDNLFSF